MPVNYRNQALSCTKSDAPYIETMPERAEVEVIDQKIISITVDWSDGRRFTLDKDHITKLFEGRNPLSSYLVLAFSPDLHQGGWIEQKAFNGDAMSKNEKD
jgi:hypothetical protein